GGTTGFEWTDLSLSTSFVGPNFPDGNPATPNEPTFVFDFFVASGDIVPGSTLFFNLIFGDYGVSPAHIDLIFATASSRTVGLTTQGGGQDGLIQAATAILTFNEVFTATAGGWDGFLQVDFKVPNDPYTAFDFVELSLNEIPFEPAPEPASLALFGGGLFALGLARRRRRR
ncbi:MAG: PEP-CTERM sorting domain-containing protein, partial [Alphaproteobacteria bacterium]|nr:PEP-CTERM sorting domain-containing protein [Alphaproteobacteria bacterium]